MKNKDLLEFYKGMISLRKAYPPLRDASNKTSEAITFSKTKDNVLAYTIPNTLPTGDFKMMAVIINTTLHPEEVELKSSYPLPDRWDIRASRHSAGLSSLGTLSGRHVIINPREVLILTA